MENNIPDNNAFNVQDLNQTPIESEQKTSFTITDKFIKKASKMGTERKNVNYWENVQAQANKPINPLAAAFMGVLKAYPQLQSAVKYNNPLISGIIGGASGYGTAEQMMELQKKRAIAELDNTPIEQIMPQAVEQYPMLKGVPVAKAKDYLTFYSSMQKAEPKPITLGTALQLKKIRPDLTDEAISSLQEPDAVKYVIEFTKESGRQERSTGKTILATDPMLEEYATSLKVPKENLIGKDENKILTMYGRIKTRQERVGYSEPQPIYNEDGDTIGYYQTSTQGKLVTNTMPLAANASQAEKNLDAVQSIMTDLFNTAKGFEPGTGVMQRFKGFAEWGKAQAGLAPDKKAYIDSIDSFLGNLSREYGGERGVLTDQDISRIKSALPRLTDTEPEIEFKLKQVYNVIAARRKAISGGKAIVPKMTLNNIVPNRELHKGSGELKINTSKDNIKKIRVKNKQTGQTGLLPESNFNPEKYERI